MMQNVIRDLEMYQDQRRVCFSLTTDAWNALEYPLLMSYSFAVDLTCNFSLVFQLQDPDTASKLDEFLAKFKRLLSLEDAPFDVVYCLSCPCFLL